MRLCKERQTAAPSRGPSFVNSITMRPRSRKMAAPVAKLERQPPADSQWGWVLTEVTVPDQIRHEHRQAACGFAPRNAHQKPLCSNKFFPHHDKPGLLVPNGKVKVTLDNDPGEISVDEISDDNMSLAVPCHKKSCRSNPNCLNYLGQSRWSDEGGFG
jgi:ubiquitin carboxyl-terminal hydrolase 48